MKTECTQGTEQIWLSKYLNPEDRTKVTFCIYYMNKVSNVISSLQEHNLKMLLKEDNK